LPALLDWPGSAVPHGSKPSDKTSLSIYYVTPLPWVEVRVSYRWIMRPIFVA
jgi:hypothetical protein